MIKFEPNENIKPDLVYVGNYPPINVIRHYGCFDYGQHNMEDWKNDEFITGVFRIKYKTK